MELVKKWEQSGLLEGARNKEDLAKTLEHSSRNLLRYMSLYNKNPTAVQTAAAMTFPIVTRVLRERNFSYVEGESSFVKETEFIKFFDVAASPDGETEICASTAANLSNKLNKYADLKVYGVHTEIKDDGFEVQFLCS